MSSSDATAYDAGRAPTSTAADLPTGTVHDEPTQSHALAVADHNEKGLAQEDHDEPEMRDVGWHEEAHHVSQPLVAGLTNEELWMYTRRFNKQIFHVKEIAHAPPGGLDLVISKDEEFSPDKLRVNLERFYMSVLIGVLGVAKHIARLRSWRERRRTAAFAVVYLAAWISNFLAPLFFSAILALIVYPPSRPVLFPPAPLALVDSQSGGVQKPKSGMLGTKDSLTGAPERYKGEAVEQEAHNFVSSIGAIGMGAMVGKSTKQHPDHEDSGVEKRIPEPTSVGLRTADADSYTGGAFLAPKHDKTKQPMEVAAWEKARPIMRVVSNIVDTWERFANALTPVPPFGTGPRRRIGGLVSVGMLISLLVGPALLVRSITFVTGAIFFGDPLIARGLRLLNRKCPNWLAYVDPRNNILLGVPTEAQITLTLLRIGEANKVPLPPPPQSAQLPSMRPHQMHADDLPLDASNDEVQRAIHPDSTLAEGDSTSEEVSKHPKHGRKIVGLVKHAARTGVSAVLGTDRLKAQIGDKNAKMRLGVLPKEEDADHSGPVDFRARLSGKKGHLYLNAATSPPSIVYSHESTRAKAETHAPVFNVAVPHITELKKVGGLGWKSRLIVGWAFEKDLADGLEIVDNRGNVHLLTAIPLRDVLFNRLVAIGAQKWESY